MKNNFFKPTLLYKEFMVLDLIEKNKNITQREISNKVGIAVSMVNSYLDDYEKKGLIKRKRHSIKTVDYLITKNGIDRRKLLNIWYLKSSQEIYSFAKDNISSFLKQIINKGFKKILLYGAGEVAELILDVIQSDKNILLEVLAVIDDDISKANHFLLEKRIISKSSVKDYVHDGILISSYTHHNAIHRKLIEFNYDQHKIIKFFS